MKQRGFITIPITGYIIAGLIAFGGIASYGIYVAVRKQGELRAEIKQRDASLVAAAEAYNTLSQERRKVETITLDNIETKETIIQEVVRYRDRIKEIVQNAPINDCIRTDLPADLEQLFNPGNDNESRETLPPRLPHSANELTVDARQNLW